MLRVWFIEDLENVINTITVATDTALSAAAEATDVASREQQAFWPGYQRGQRAALAALAAAFGIEEEVRQLAPWAHQ